MTPPRRRTGADGRPDALVPSRLSACDAAEAGGVAAHEIVGEVKNVVSNVTMESLLADFEANV